METMKFLAAVLTVSVSSLPWLTASNEAIPTQTCVFSLIDCNYTLTLAPNAQCWEDQNTRKTRIRRSYNIEDVSISPGTGPLDNMDLIARKIKKLENKLTKESKVLSTRVLRAARQMKAMFKQLTVQKRKGLGQDKRCPEGFVTADDWSYCYMLSKFNTTWYEARDFCGAFNSDIVSLDTLKEHYLVTFLIKNHKAHREATGWWTSGTFVAGTKQWMWTTDIEKRPFTFIKWASGEPNEESSQCMYLSKHDDHLWHDDVCTAKFNFICKIFVGKSP